MVPENHPTNALLSQFALGKLPDGEHERIEVHLDACEACWQRLLGDKQDDDAFVALLRQSTDPALGDDDTIVNLDGDATPNMHPLAVSDRYQLMERIASGGMGVIWVAHDLLLDREVAIKVLRDTKHRNANVENSLLDRFVRESQIVSSLQHPGIPPTYDLGRLSDGKPFLAMKLVQGKTLAQRMAEDEPPSIDWLLEVFRGVCQTLAFAHSRGIVHRDLKPDNIMVGQFGETQVMDWGISEHLNQAGNENEPRTVIGTPAYMSPEQANGRRCGPQADVFALGSILCEMLTGEPAYRGQNSSQLMELAVAGAVDDAISRLRHCDAEPAIVELAIHCLAKESGERPANAADVAHRVAEHLHTVQARLRAAELDRAKQQARSLEQKRRRKTQRWLAFSAACLVVVSLLAFRVHRNRIADKLSQVERAIEESMQIRDNAGAATQGALERIQRAQTLAERAVHLSRETRDNELQSQAESLFEELEAQGEFAAGLVTLQEDLQRAMIFEEGFTVDQRHANRQQVLRQAVSENRRSTLLFLQFPNERPRPGPDLLTTSGPTETPRLPPRRRHGRALQPKPSEFLTGKANVFRYAALRQQEYSRAFQEVGLRLEAPMDDSVALVSDLEPEDREMVLSGLRMWFLLAVDTRSRSAHQLSEMLEKLDRKSGRPARCAAWAQMARRAMLDREFDAIVAAANAASPLMAELSPELLWGLGCFQLRCSPEPDTDGLLRHAQRHFLDSFLLNRELVRLHGQTRNRFGADAYINGALAVYTDYELSIQLARSLVASGRWDEYEIVRERCFDQYPDDPLMFADWGDFMAMTRREEVFVTYQRALDAGYPEPQIIIARIGQLYERDGFFEEAIEQYQDALALENFPDQHAQELQDRLSQLVQDTRTDDDASVTLTRPE